MVREVLAGVAAARWAADNLARRLEKGLREAKEVIACSQAQLECGSGGDAPEAEARRREAIARPALVARVRGRRETRAQRLRRHVAWHAERCPSADAPPQAWRRAQRGPRLPGGPLPGDGHGCVAQSASVCEVETCVCEVQPPIECALDVCVAEAPARLPSARVAAARTPLRSSAQPRLPEWARWAALLEELGVAQLAEQGCSEVGAESTEAEEIMEPPLAADSVDCSAGDGHSSSEGAFVSFLDGFSVAAVARAAKGPKSGVESLLDLAEARALGVRLGGAGCADAEEHGMGLAAALAAREVVAVYGCEPEEDRAMAARCSAWRPNRAATSESEDSFVGDSEFEDLESEHWQFLRDEFSDGSEQAAEHEGLRLLEAAQDFGQAERGSRAAALAWRAAALRRSLEAHWQLANRAGAHAPKFGEAIAAARVFGAKLAAGAVQVSPAPSIGDGEGDGGSGLSASERSLAAELGGKRGQDELESVDAVWESDVAVEVCVAEPAAEPCHPAGPRARRWSGALPCRSRRTPLRGGAVPYSVVEALGCGPLAPADRVGRAPLPPVLGHASAERGASGRASVDGSADASDVGSSRPSTRGPVEYADDVVPHLGGCCVGSDDIVEGPAGGSANEDAVGMEPLVADSVGCTAGDGHAGSECGFVSFLDDFSVAAVARAAQGPKSGVESLLDWAEARALGQMARAGSPRGGSWHSAQRRSRAERTAARRRAQDACDRGLEAARAEAEALSAELDECHSWLDALGRALGDGAVARRLAAVAPALAALLGGFMPTVSVKLGRDVALHSAAEGLDVDICVAAPLARLLPALAAEAPRPERGPVQMRAEAAPSWPRRPAGCWAMLGPARVDVLLAALGAAPAVEVAGGTVWQVTDGSDLPAGSGHKLEDVAECTRKYCSGLGEAERGGLCEHAGGTKCLATGSRGLLAGSVGNAEADLEEEEFVSDGSERGSALGEAEHGGTAMHGSDDGFDDGYPEAEQDFDFHARMRASDEAWQAALAARLRARDEAWEASLEESIEPRQRPQGGPRGCDSDNESGSEAAGSQVWSETEVASFLEASAEDTPYSDRFQRALLQSGLLHVKHRSLLERSVLSMVTIFVLLLWLFHLRRPLRASPAACV
ncbi:unnamed protein product [Prorocentrum cordatum]|uniref:Uncharacterized protein n=1 Tax=Prorocentrum cordatum TaxID=2364126 RepID=A0ABN9PA67_9DINO|nr:unnamed protein product [Polarella glacialis]